MRTFVVRKSSDSFLNSMKARNLLKALNKQADDFCVNFICYGAKQRKSSGEISFQSQSCFEPLSIEAR